MVNTKHALKNALREAYARVLFHTGLHALVDRVMPRRLTILAGHCVSAPCNARLPGDMKIDADRLARILRWFARRYEVASVGAAVTRLGERGSKSLVALSMDDGYADNVTHLLPILRAAGVSATIYLESRPLSERRVNWSHKFFTIVDRLSPSEFVARYSALSRDEKGKAALANVLQTPGRESYRLKRALKYDADPDDRSRVLDVLFADTGGDERALCDELYMTWAGARALRDAGVELGAHTVHHEILSRLSGSALAHEVADCKRVLERELATSCPSFAYPFGRRWDFHTEAAREIAAAGFASAVTTHAGTNAPGVDRYRLKRLMIDENARLHVLATEACGGFDLLRRFGLDLSE